MYDGGGGGGGVHTHDTSGLRLDGSARVPDLEEGKQ